MYCECYSVHTRRDRHNVWCMIGRSMYGADGRSESIVYDGYIDNV